MPSTTVILSVIAGLVALFSAIIFLFGIPPELKRKMERAALKTMGENKASYMMKDQISKIPASDQKEIKDFKGRLGDTLGGSMQNPLGEATGETADEATRPLTGR
ncbi:hypothetical protein K402DRAFT_416273 [Aulographum hederae CBS 113979]|uniref:Uncharacterized protein n=1 Tax=Aulographum hederae CBS 113979 TaxID=1176131 RepID=A0A6G1HHB9_9PEZI|nr:hypothetical protein K402DRAFT_416273 [Aulographum hederae CBS 113979]